MIFCYFILFYLKKKLENQNDQSRQYLIVMEYADSGSLQSYLKENFIKLSWEDKYKLAYQLACAVLYLHDKGIEQRNLVINIELFVILII
jgi:serine/threonine protein kinase